MGAEQYFDCIRDINPNILSLYERGYVIDYCVSALKKKREEFIYRTYITDALQAIAANTAHYVGASGLVEAGMTMRSRYADIINTMNDRHSGKDKKKEKEETRTADDVISNLKNKLKRLGSKKGE